MVGVVARTGLCAVAGGLVCLLLTTVLPNKSGGVGSAWSSLRTSLFPGSKLGRSPEKNGSTSLSQGAVDSTDSYGDDQLEIEVSIRKTPPSKLPYEGNTTTSLGLPSLLSLFQPKKEHANSTGSSGVVPLWTQSRYGANSNTPISGDKRIVGGTQVEAGAYPTYAFTAGSQLCGSTLIWYDVLLTAAHCDAAFLDGILIGGLKIDGSDGRFVQVTEEYPHPEYSFETDANDIMLVGLSERIQDVPLQALNFDDSTPPDEQELTVIGLGYVNEGGPFSDDLLEVKVNVVDFETCDGHYGKIENDIMLCAGIEEGGMDSCQGDSGGPLLNDREFQVGVVSFGEGCARPNTPAVYARVSAYEDYINDGICRLSANPPSSCDTDTPTLTPGTGNATLVPDDAGNATTSVPTISPSGASGANDTTMSPQNGTAPPTSSQNNATIAPSLTPSGLPTGTGTGTAETQAPTQSPTEAPSLPPLAVPDDLPTEPPTQSPSKSPTKPPIESSLESPTAMATPAPTRPPVDPPVLLAVPIPANGGLAAPTRQNPAMLPTPVPTMIPTTLDPLVIPPSFFAPRPQPTSLVTRIRTAPPRAAPGATPVDNFSFFRPRERTNNNVRPSSISSNRKAMKMKKGMKGMKAKKSKKRNR